MKTIQMYEPAMCCATGLCGPSIDPDLLRISFIMHHVQNQPTISAERFNLTNHPDVFIENQQVNQLVMEEGMDCLPITLVDGSLAVKGRYPTTEEFSEWTGIPTEELAKKPKIRLNIKGDVSK